MASPVTAGLIDRFRSPLRVWVSRALSAHLPSLTASLGDEAEVHPLAEGSLPPSAGPAVLLAAPSDLAPANEPVLRELVQAAEPGRLVLYGGEQDRAVLLTAINHWRVFRLIPSVTGIPAVVDAIQKAHETTEMELALERGIRDLAEQNEHLGRTLERLQRTRGQLLHAERLTTLGRLTTGLGQALDSHRVATEDLSAATKRVSLDAELLDVVERTLEGGRALDSLLSDLLYFAENRERPLHLAHHDADAIATAALRLAEVDPISRKRNLTISLRSGSCVCVDRYAIYQVLINLLRNAMQATSDGGTIRLSTSLVDGEVVFEVSDNGVGMSAETQARLFEPFFTTKGRDGLGLGLRVSRLSVERHGGRLECSSVAGAGTTFRLYLPISAH